MIIEDFGSPRLDGLSQWIDDHPIMLVNASPPTDRIRWTLAHELGHLVMHSDYVTGDSRPRPTSSPRSSSCLPR